MHPVELLSLSRPQYSLVLIVILCLLSLLRYVLHNWRNTFNPTNGKKQKGLRSVFTGQEGENPNEEWEEEEEEEEYFFQKTWPEEKLAKLGPK